ncbi:unnamed protein product [Clavelina lepadiformis]|uniref:F-box domain-containing protein n=1 Tax=Clavelina lepadiformis TaxID=159417 RepID=A0ABP0F8E2_CLALP
MVSWKILTNDCLMEIFQLLSYKDLARAGQVCRRWKSVADLEFLWECRLKQDYNVKREIPLRPGAVCWKEEYERLVDRVPCVELKKIEEHSDEVFHVSFSNNGLMFCTSSKDTYVKVYNADSPFDIVFSSQPRGNYWTCAQMSRFSPCDTQLLVSGSRPGREQYGEIVIYSIFGGTFSIQARVRIRPYDVMGTWLNESHFLSARAHSNYGKRQCLCEVFLNKSGQKVVDPQQPNATRSFLFRCDFGTVSYLHVADLTKPLRQVVQRNVSKDVKELLHYIHYKHLQKLSQSYSHNEQDTCTEYRKGSVCEACSVQTSAERNAKRMEMMSLTKFNSATNCFSLDTKTSQGNTEESTEVDEHDTRRLLKSFGIQKADTDSFTKTYHAQVFSNVASDQGSISTNHPGTSSSSLMLPVCEVCKIQVLPDDANQKFAASEIDTSSVASTVEEVTFASFPARYKLFLCFTGSRVCVHHQIGVKILHQEECSKVVEEDISQMLSDHPDDYSRLDVDTWDHVFELPGQCVGMTLSPCNRYLYVNMRRFICMSEEDIMLEDSPSVSKEVEMFVYDLITMERVAILTGHNAESDVFFLHLSSNDYYVASGSEDDRGCIWDRHYQACVASLHHDKVVSCVAVNPRDTSMAVSVSDDNKVKIWGSKSFHKKMKHERLIT